MLRTKSKQSYLKKAVKVRHHGRLYFVNKAKLSFVLSKIGVCKKFDFLNENLKDFLSKNKLLYTEFLHHVSDSVKVFDK